MNKHRQLICAIYNYANSEVTYDGVEENPAARADRRREPEPARLDYYSPAEIEKLAHSLEAGQHRGPGSADIADCESDARAEEDKQDADLVRIAAYTGLRRGELLALRWRDVEPNQSKLIVGAQSAPTKRRYRRSPGEPARSQSRIRQLRRSTVYVNASISPPMMTLLSSTGWGVASTDPHYAVASSEHETPRVCANSASTTSDTRTALCSSLGALISRL